ncbi:HNH endonuclease [Klebsiella oxytoca]|uniref:HNH endonuclease n=1 Tax=Klebsiella oxytoca TaxID=571 RepID=UPI001CCFA148|nr:HNH endonuclease signature motif containing protein [Klebsiella oxytoca]MBZ6767391.1 HNH endonuclease [Klebsiella oxytoca]
MPIPDNIAAKILVKSARHCCICRKFSPLQIQIHHIVAQSEGGLDDEDNLIPICISCHSSVHSKMHMTKGFSRAELKGHRNAVYDMVEKGKLPAQPQVTGDEMHALSTVIIETLKAEGKSQDLSERATEILLAAACEESPALINRTDDGIIIESNGQTFHFYSKEVKQYPDELFELAHAGFMSLDGATSSITNAGIAHVQKIVKTTAKYTEKKVRCMKCSLHFTIFSWYPELHRANTLHCPECGQSEGLFIVWAQQKFGFIFQKVPGNSSLWDMGNLP